MPHYVASDLGLHCLPMTLLRVSRYECVKVNGYTFRGRSSIIFLSLPPYSLGANSERKEFAPLGENSFLEEWTLLGRLHSQEKKTGVHVVPLCKAGSRFITLGPLQAWWKTW